MLVLSFTKYISVTARATRQCLKEEERVKSEKRGDVGLRYQQWENGKAGEQVCCPTLWPSSLADLLACQTWVREPTEEEHK